MTSREQRLIITIKEHIATHTNLFLWFKSLNTQTISDKTLSNIKLYLARFLTVTPQTSLSLQASRHAWHAHF